MSVPDAQTETMGRLADLAGEWAGEEEIAASQWTAAGTAASTVSARLELGGIYLVQRYRQLRDGAIGFQSHNVLGEDRAEGRIGLCAFDSAGFLPPSPAMGCWQGAVLTLVRSSPRGMQRTSFRLEGSDAYAMVVAFSADGSEAGLETMVRARVRRPAPGHMLKQDTYRQ